MDLRAGNAKKLVAVQLDFDFGAKHFKIFVINI